MGVVGLRVVSAAMAIVAIGAFFLGKVAPPYFDCYERLLLCFAALVAGGLVGFWAAMEYAEQIARDRVYESPGAWSVFNEIAAKSIPFPHVLIGIFVPAFVFHMASKARKRNRL